MEHMEYIDNYFKGSNSQAQKQEFERRIVEDASFAEEVAFYISTHQIAQQQSLEEKKQRFRDIYNEQKENTAAPAPVRKFSRYAMAASITGVLLILSLVFLFRNNSSPQQMADAYAKENWKKLGVSMDNDRNSLQHGLKLYNDGKFAESAIIFESVLKTDSTNDYAKRYLGIAYFSAGDFEKALQCFSLLAANTSLQSNPGMLYKAVTLLKRNKSGDKEAAKDLLQKIVDDDLEGKPEAEEWLHKLK
ncbi:MAG: tetratricopeptide repeat protein [Agriterribacter sp.]